MAIIIFLSVVILLLLLLLYRSHNIIKSYHKLIEDVITNENVAESSIATTAIIFGLSVEELYQMVKERKVDEH